MFPFLQQCCKRSQIVICICQWPMKTSEIIKICISLIAVDCHSFSILFLPGVGNCSTKTVWDHFCHLFLWVAWCMISKFPVVKARPLHFLRIKPIFSFNWQNCSPVFSLHVRVSSRVQSSKVINANCNPQRWFRKENKTYYPLQPLYIFIFSSKFICISISCKVHLLKYEIFLTKLLLTVP